MTEPGPIHRFLADDHERLDALLAAALGPSGEIDLVSYAAFREGLLRHIGMEEKVLFPASRRGNGGTPLPISPRLHRDHGALALLLVPTPSASLIEEIRSILVEHNEVEEGTGGVYDACDRLSREDVESVLEALQTFPRIKVAPHFDGPETYRRAEDALRAVSRGEKPVKS